MIAQLPPGDGSSSGIPCTVSVVIRNTPPTVAGGYFSPAVVRTNDSLRIAAAGADADGDTVTLVIMVGGGPVGGDAESLDGSTHFDKGDSVTVVVTPSDVELGESVRADCGGHCAPSGLTA